MNGKSLIVLSLILSISSFCFGQGSAYSGAFISSARIEYVNKTDMVIEGKVFNNTPSHSIILWSCSDIIIRNCKFTSSPKYLGVYLERCKNITIENCTFENLATALLAENCSDNIKFEYNDVKNILGSSKGGSIAGSMVQFVRMTGAGNSVSYNVCENIPGESAPEDIINMNDQSSGTPESPIIIANNWIRGGGPSGSGGGINLGDVNGSYQTAENNILVDPGQYGIAISGGHHNVLRNNKVYATKQDFTNVGIIVCNWYAKNGFDCHDVTVANNEVNYINKNGNANTLWNANNCGEINGWNTNTYNPQLKATILPIHILSRAKIKPPAWMPGWPKLTDIKQDGFSASIKLNEEVMAYFVVLPANEAAPTPIQIKEGKDASDKLLGWNQKGKVFCDTPKAEYTFSATFLNHNTSYIVHFTAENLNFGILIPDTMLTFATSKELNLK